MTLIKGLGPGGAEKLLTLAIPHLDRDRFDYEVCYMLPWKDALVPEFQNAGIPTRCLNRTKEYDLRIIPQLVRFLKERHVDVLHMHLPYAGIVGRISGKLVGTRAMVYTEHSLFEHHHRVTAWANRLTYPWNDAAICVSEAVRRSVVTEGKVKRSVPLNTIYNGIDMEAIAVGEPGTVSVREEFGIPENHKLVVNVANFNPQKRHEDLLKAAQLTLQSDPLVTFLLVGHGRLQGSMQQMAKDLGIEHNVVFTGFRTDAPKIMAAGDVFVLSSRYEGLPVSLLEAMAAGTAVVATNVGGIPEAVTDGVEGLLVEHSNPQQLAGKILRVLHDPDLRERLSSSARQRVLSQFNTRQMVGRIEDLYLKVLSESGQSAESRVFRQT